MAQSLSKLYVHLVFSTKGRTDTLPKQHLEDVHKYVAAIMNDIKCPAICVGGTSNHIHILYIQNKTMAPADVVRTVKANSSKWINEHNGLMNHFCWQDGYGMFSISNGHVDAVINYINIQEEHHKDVSFQDELRKIFKQCGVEYDERYVWD